MYDAFQTRAKKTVNGSDTFYAYGLYERRMDGNSATHVFYISNGQRAVAQITAFDGANPAPKTTYIHTDSLGSTHVTDAGLDQPDVIRINRDPFGNKMAAAGSNTWDINLHAQAPGPQGTTEVKLGFTGHEEDSELGLINMNGRIYDPRLGRMLQADPIVSAPFATQGFNRYSYAMNNPLRYVDPTGHCAYAQDDENEDICNAREAQEFQNLVDYDWENGVVKGSDTDLLNRIAEGELIENWDQIGPPQGNNMVASFYAAQAAASDAYWTQREAETQGGSTVSNQGSVTCGGAGSPACGDPMARTPGQTRVDNQADRFFMGRSPTNSQKTVGQATLDYNREHVVGIINTSNGGLRLSQITVGAADDREVRFSLTLRSGESLAGIAHTHFDVSGAEHLSSTDIGTARKLGVPLYGLTSPGLVEVYDPRRNTITTLPGPGE